MSGVEDSGKRLAKSLSRVRNFKGSSPQNGSNSTGHGGQDPKIKREEFEREFLELASKLLKANPAASPRKIAIAVAFTVSHSSSTFGIEAIETLVRRGIENGSIKLPKMQRMPSRPKPKPKRRRA